MKLTIEIDQPTPAVAPTVTVSVDGEPIGLIQNLELLARADRSVPKLMLKFPSFTAALSSDAGVDAVKARIAACKKALAKFPWIDVT